MPSPNSSPKRPTLKDIAMSAGVSTASVSHALNPRQNSNINLPEETVKKIKEIADRLNYRPNAGARAIRTNRFHNVGLFMAKQGKYTHLPDGYLAGVHDAAEENGYRVTLIRLPEEIETVQTRVPKIFDEHNLDALIIASYHHVTKLIHERLKDQNLPVIYLNDLQKHNAIAVDDLGGSEIMTRHLVERGYKSISFTLRQSPTMPPIADRHYSQQQRLQGYLNVMEESGLKPHVVHFAAKEVIGFDEVFPDDWWPQVKDSDAIFAYDDELANRIARFLYSQRIHVPDDIALAGYNGDYASLSAWCRLTTMRIPAYRIGRAAFKMALESMESGKAKPAPSLTFLPELKIGDSTR